ncbi:Uncharacterised protein [uncultured archaeon]|nr:Uncharacterised protein [uncultured archaeon]
MAAVLLLLALFSSGLEAQVSITTPVNLTVGVASNPVLVLTNFTIQPGQVPIVNNANFSVEAYNAGNENGSASSEVTIYDMQNNTVAAYTSGLFVVPFGESANISLVRPMAYAVSNYTAIAVISYSGSATGPFTAGPVSADFSITTGQPPTVNLISPLNDTWTHDTNDTLQFRFSYSDIDSPDVSCLLYIDGAAVQSNSSVLRDTETVMLANSSIYEGHHTWYVSCIDLGNNVNETEHRNVNTGSFCADVYTDNLGYTLMHDISSDGSCIRITGANVVLDCAGHAINYSDASAGYAVNVTGANATIRNCNIFQGGNVSGSTGILLDHSPAATIANSAFVMGGDSGNELLLSSSSGGLFANNTLVLSGLGGYSIHLANSSDNMFAYNTINVSTLASTAILKDSTSFNNTFAHNTINIDGLSGSSATIIADPVNGANATLPATGVNPIVSLYIPPGSVGAVTYINVTSWYGNMAEKPISVSSRRGRAAAFVNISASPPPTTDSSNPYILTINYSTLDVNDVQASRFYVYLYNEATNEYEPIVSDCNVTARTCVANLTHFSQYSLMAHVPSVSSAPVGMQQLPISGALACTKEFAEITTTPGASVSVTFQDKPYSDLAVKSGVADADGNFTFLADLPGTYKVAVQMSGSVDNSLLLTAADDCVPRITFVKKVLDCSGSACSFNIPVMTTSMKNVQVDLSDIANLLQGSASVRDKFGGPVSLYSYVGSVFSFPLITDRFVISSETAVTMSQESNITTGKVVTTLTNRAGSGRVSGISISLPSMGANTVQNVTFTNNAGASIAVSAYSVSGGRLVIDQQLPFSTANIVEVGYAPTPLTCQASADCPLDSACISSTCVVVPCSCGYLIDRACVKYECCADSDCGEDRSCLSNVCVRTPPSITAAERQIIADRISVLLTNIQVAQQQGQPVESAQQLLSDAKTAYEAGDFAAARDLLAQAQQIFTAQREVTTGLPLLLIVEVVVIGLVLAFAAMVLFRLARGRQGFGKWKKYKK